MPENSLDDDHFVYVSGAPGGLGPNSLISAQLTRPDYDVGDRLHLSPDWSHPRQIRPLVAADMIPGVGYSPDLRMVVFRLPKDEGTLRPVVRLLPHQRVNTPCNADAAWRMVLREMPGIARLYGDAVRIDG